MQRPSLAHFFFNETTTTEIYTLSLTTLFRSQRRRRRARGLDGAPRHRRRPRHRSGDPPQALRPLRHQQAQRLGARDRKSTRLNSSHVRISYAVFCLKKKNTLNLSGSRVGKCHVKASPKYAKTFPCSFFF